MLDAEDKRSGRVHMLAFALRAVLPGRELLLDYGPEYWRHMREERNRAQALLVRAKPGQTASPDFTAEVLLRHYGPRVHLARRFNIGDRLPMQLQVRIANCTSS